MFKRVFLLIKKVMLSILFIYAFNKMAVSLNLMIPINFYTILLVGFGGIPAIVMLAVYSVMFI